MSNPRTRSVPLCRRYVNMATGIESDRLVDLLDGQVICLAPQWVCRKEEGRHRMPFGGIELLPAHTTLPEWAKSLNAPGTDVDITIDDYIRRFIKTFVDAVEAAWQSSVTKLVLHTSGFDSRMLSWALGQLQKKHGANWIGNILYVCWGTECAASKRVIEYQRAKYGLSGELISLGDNGNDSDVDPELLDIGNVWDAFGCIVDKPINFLASIWREMSGRLANCGELELWSMAFSNESFKRGHTSYWPADFPSWHEAAYWHYIGEWPEGMSAQIRYPMLFEEVVRFMMAHKTNWDVGTIRRRVVQGMDADLADLPRADEDQVGYERQYRWLNDDLASQVQRQYDASWYNRSVCPGGAVALDAWQASEFWRHWSFAGICEHLLATGSSLQIGHACV